MTESDTNPLGHIGVPPQFTVQATRSETSPQRDNWALQSEKLLPGRLSRRPRKQASSFRTKRRYFHDRHVKLLKDHQPIRSKVNVITSDSKNSKSSSAHIGSGIASYIRQSSDNEKAFHHSDNRQVLLSSSSHINITDGPSPFVFGSVPVEAINTPASTYHFLLSCLLIYMKVSRQQPISSQQLSISTPIFPITLQLISQWKCTHYLFQYNPALIINTY